MNVCVVVYFNRMYIILFVNDFWYFDNSDILQISTDDFLK